MQMIHVALVAGLMIGFTQSALGPRLELSREARPAIQAGALPGIAGAADDEDEQGEEDADGAKTQYRLVFGSGTHVCQSRTSLGHKCEVRAQARDCNELRGKLKSLDCCPSTTEGGHSINLEMGSCRSF